MRIDVNVSQAVQDYYSGSCYTPKGGFTYSVARDDWDKMMFGKSKIKRVIFHDPATIVFWTDGSKTVVKTMPGDIYNPEVGLAMCISKKVLGNKYHHEFKKWLKEIKNEKQ